jgi:hypothetical protein
MKLSLAKLVREALRHQWQSRLRIEIAQPADLAYFHLLPSWWDNLKPVDSHCMRNSASRALPSVCDIDRLRLRPFHVPRDPALDALARPRA